MDDVARHQRLWWEHIRRLNALSPDEKIRAAGDARRISLELLRAGIRLRRPDATPEDVEDEVGLRIHGPEVWEKFRKRDGRGHRPARD